MNISRFEGKKILVTGAGGLIGQAIVRALISHKSEHPVKVVALVRNEAKARKTFSDISGNSLEYMVCDVCNLEPVNLNVDYIVHCASFTSSQSFVCEPVEVICKNVEGTVNVLEFARANDVKGLVYLSTMEVYGAPSDDIPVTEVSPSYLDCMKPRSSYPESKRLCECLCASYCSEYGVKAKVVRLTQTFGAGVAYGDGRVFAEFARSVIEGKDIVLKTKGETERNYLYIGDAVNAVLTVLLDGVPGEAYNAANEDTYCSIYDMANMVAEKFGNGKTSVVIEEGSVSENMQYAPVMKMNLRCAKLRALGWQPEKGLTESFSEMIAYMKANRNS